MSARKARQAIMTPNEMANALLQRDGYIIITHTNPDGDAIGCASAICSALRRAGKTAYIFSNPQITEKFFFLTEGYYPPEGYEAETVLAVDTAAENMFCKGFSGHVDLCIDHHPSNSRYADTLLLEGGRAACGEIIYEVITAMNGGITKEEADALWVAVSTDTGCFCYANTNADTMRCAALLIEVGASNAKLNKEFFRSFSAARLKLEGMVFSTLRSYRDNKINIAIITKKMEQECGITEDDCDDLASLAGRVRGSVVSITIRETDDGISKISVRTNELVNACTICSQYGGGGHAMASGCKIKAPAEEAAAMIYKTTCEVWPE